MPSLRTRKDPMPWFLHMVHGEKRLEEALKNGSDPFLNDEVNSAIADPSLNLRNALLICVRENRESVLPLLAGHVGDLNVTTPEGTSLLMIAIMGKNLSIARWLIDAGASVTHTLSFGDTPLHFASRYNLPALIVPMLRARADANARDNRGSTPLHILLRQGGLAGPGLKALAAAATHDTWTVPNHDGLTPLMIAHGIVEAGQVEHYNPSVLSALFARGATVSIKVGGFVPHLPSPWDATAKDPERRLVLTRALQAAHTREKNALLAVANDVQDPVGMAPAAPRGRL